MGSAGRSTSKIEVWGGAKDGESSFTCTLNHRYRYLSYLNGFFLRLRKNDGVDV